MHVAAFIGKLHHFENIKPLYLVSPIWSHIYSQFLIVNFPSCLFAYPFKIVICWAKTRRFRKILICHKIVLKQIG